jgi:heterodisulfide reductase subunit C
MPQLQRYRELFTGFQRVRWHAAAACMQGELTHITEKQWTGWLETPVDPFIGGIAQGDISRGLEQLRDDFDTARLSACFTCGECSSACPVSGGRSVFDPRTLFWLCVSCGRCTEACSQLVDGRQLISRIQELAVETGAVDIEFRLRLEQANKVIYNRFLEEVDKLFDPDREIVETFSTKEKFSRMPTEYTCMSLPV